MTGVEFNLDEFYTESWSSLETIIPCEQSHLQALSKLSGRAFLHDPLYVQVFPQPETRQSLIAWELGIILSYGLRFGEVYATSNLSGCAVWLPPGETDFTEQRMAQVGMLDYAAHLGADTEKRLMTFVTESEKYHHKVAPRPHGYLVLLAVDPPWQGQGLGSALLARVLARADAGGFPTYLETTHASNLPFYQKHGFAVRAQATLPDGGAYVWYLVRDVK